MKNILLSLLLVAMLAMGLPVTSISAAAPTLPHYFYGTVTISGAPAPVGTSIRASVPGVISDGSNPIVTTQPGQYGSANPLANVPRLLVQGSITSGAIISFYVNGVLASQTAAWQEGQISVLNLTATTGFAISQVAPLAGTVGAAYSQTLAATGGITPYTWSISAGTLPAGLALNAATGIISGTPAGAGTFTFTVQVSDSTVPPAKATMPLSLTVTAPSGSAGAPPTTAAPPPTTPPSATVDLRGLSSSERLELDYRGEVSKRVELEDQAKECKLSIDAGTLMRDANNMPLGIITHQTVASPPASPSGSVVIGVRDFGPNGAQFSPPVTLTMLYDPAKLPAGTRPEQLYIAWWNGKEWVALSGTVDSNTKTVIAKVDHFTTFALLTKVAAPVPTAATTPPAATPTHVPVPVSTPVSAPVTTSVPAPPSTPAPAPGPSAPQKGFEWWPIVAIAGAALILGFSGFVIYKKREPF